MSHPIAGLHSLGGGVNCLGRDWPFKVLSSFHGLLQGPLFCPTRNCYQTLVTPPAWRDMLVDMRGAGRGWQSVGRREGKLCRKPSRNFAFPRHAYIDYNGGPRTHYFNYQLHQSRAKA